MMKVAEAFLAGHPDKVCDQVAEAILDEFLRRDEKTRAQIVVFGGHGAMMISGEVASRADFDCAEIAKRVYREVGYEDAVEPFVHLGMVPEELLAASLRGAASGTVTVTGYATRQTREMLPLAQVYAQALARRLDEARQHDASLAWLRPDGRVIVGVEQGKVVLVCLFVQHGADATVQQVYGDLLDTVVRPVVGDIERMKLFVNPAGSFTQGGLQVGTGLSGRATGADLYGGLIPTGALTLSGRGPTDPARAGAYAVRHAARALVLEGLVSQALVQATYLAGRADPVMLQASGDAGADLTAQVKDIYDWRPEALADRFALRAPQYRRLALYGPFGRTDAAWET